MKMLCENDEKCSLYMNDHFIYPDYITQSQ